MTKTIIKTGKNRRSEDFIRDKLHMSISSACLSVFSPVGSAEDIASQVCDNVILWLENKSEVTSADIRRIAGYYLDKLHPGAAYLYNNQGLII